MKQIERKHQFCSVGVEDPVYPHARNEPPQSSPQIRETVKRGCRLTLIDPPYSLASDVQLRSSFTMPPGGDGLGRLTGLAAAQMQSWNMVWKRYEKMERSTADTDQFLLAMLGPPRMVRLRGASKLEDSATRQEGFRGVAQNGRRFRRPFSAGWVAFELGAFSPYLVPI